MLEKAIPELVPFGEQRGRVTPPQELNVPAGSHCLHRSGTNRDGSRESVSSYCTGLKFSDYKLRPGAFISDPSRPDVLYQLDSVWSVTSPQMTTETYIWVHNWLQDPKDTLDKEFKLPAFNRLRNSKPSMMSLEQLKAEVHIWTLIISQSDVFSEPTLRPYDSKLSRLSAGQ